MKENEGSPMISFIRRICYKNILGKFILKIDESKKQRNLNERTTKWKLLPFGRIKINTDVALFTGEKIIDMMCVARNTTSKSLGTFHCL